MSSFFHHLPALLVPLAVVTLGCPVGCSSGTVNDTTLPKNPDLLVAPATGQGFQFKTGAVSVPPGTEEQDCYFFKVSDLAKSGGLPADQPVMLHKVQIVQTAGSHHMNLFRVRTIVGLDPANGNRQPGTNGAGECFKSSNWADWPLIANTQQAGALDWSYPDGVANELDPGETLMLQTHFVNATTQQTPNDAGKVAVNFFAMPKEKVTAQLGTLFATKQSVRICAHNATPKFEGSCQIKGASGDVHIIGANGHFHSRGTEFDIFSWDGTSTTTPPDSARFYQSTTWSDPPMLHSPTVDVIVPPGGGVWYTCAYQWQAPDPSIGCDGLDAFDAKKYSTPASNQDCCYTFGPLVDKNEHCNAFVYYYPKQDDVNCF